MFWPAAARKAAAAPSDGSCSPQVRVAVAINRIPQAEVEVEDAPW
jgi:hypothetical protein